MTNRTCPEKGMQIINERCCHSCPAGKYMKTECSDTQQTVCEDCSEDSYTATPNRLKKCIQCKKCSSIKYGKQQSACTSKQDTVCECESGFYCSDENCGHCQQLKECKEGEGVQIQASRTSNLVCAPCENGTYSNVTDFLSPCVSHTRCEDIGRELDTPGTSKTDAVCRAFKTYCPWMLPAGLWAGLVLTIIVVAAFIFWRAKRRSHRPAIHIIPIKMTPNPAVTPPELISHCQETCIENDCKLPLFNTDDPPIVCSTEDSLDSSCPITPLKASVSFAESCHSSAKCNTGNFCRSYSEPQEDEWCGAY